MRYDGITSHGIRTVSAIHITTRARQATLVHSAPRVAIRMSVSARARYALVHFPFRAVALLLAAKKFKNWSGVVVPLSTYSHNK